MTCNNYHMKKLVLNLPALGKGDWWIEISTSKPDCVYYFGPFLDRQEASDSCGGYVDDLVREGALEINTVIKRCQPADLTTCHEDYQPGETDADNVHYDLNAWAR